MLVNPITVSTAKLIVRNDIAFTLPIRIKGYTVSLNAYMTLSIRVCGAETISLVNQLKKSYIFGIETGDLASMNDVTRYIIIPESTFATWFTVVPSADPCTVNSY